MNQKLLVQNHLFYLPKIASKYKEIVYSPVIKSEVQKVYFFRRFKQLKKKFNAINFEAQEGPSSFEHVLAWNAINEERTFGHQLLAIKNRLFDRPSFNLSGSFTDFRKTAEQQLPAYFEDACAPFDQEVVDELAYYFDEKKLPRTYLDTRNDFLGRDFSTKFSPYLSSGALHVRHLYNRVKDFEADHGKSKSSYWIIFELLWRDFFYWHYQENRKKYFSKTGLTCDSLDYTPFQKYNEDEARQLSTIPFYQAALNELILSGFMSNRARQIFASIWINDLKLDWRSGADLFERYLIDYDVYSNYGNWMYLAGVGVDPRGKRYFKVEKQLGQYDPKGLYLSTWLPTKQGHR